jgi:ZIP family zinc transporter
VIHVNLYPILLGLAALLSTLAGGLVATKLSSSRLGTLTAFAAGVLIAVPLFDLLPEALKLAEQVGMNLSRPLEFTALGFVFLYILERYFSVHRVCEGGVCRNVRHPKGGLLGALELSAHSFVDGFAIGLGFHVANSVGFVVALAVVSHDFADGINTVTVMLKSGNSLKPSMRMLLLDAVAPLLGAATTLFITLPEGALVFLLSFFAGGFLYLGAGDLLPEAHEQNPPLISVASSLTGFLLIFGLTRWLNV